MSIATLVHSSSLIGQEVKETLARDRKRWTELRLRTTDEEEVGTLTEIAGAAAMVQQLEKAELEDADVVILCGTAEQSRPLLADLPTTASAIVLATDGSIDGATPVIAGINDASLERGQLVLSPHPGVILAAHLLRAAAPLAPRRATATLLQSSSAFGREGLDELLDQTRSILAFAPEQPREVLGRQLAFSLYPSDPSPLELAGQLGACLGEDAPDLEVAAVQAGVFHGIAISLHVEFPDDPGLERLQALLEESPHLVLAETAPAVIDVAGQDVILVAEISRSTSAGGYWIWAVMDNLTCGGALNAVRILEAIQQPYVH